MALAASIALDKREGTVIGAKAVAATTAAPRKTVAIPIWDGLIEPDEPSK
jgi:hypothetical protein